MTRRAAQGLHVAGLIGLCNVLAAGLRRPIPPQQIDALLVVLWYDIGLEPGAVVSMNLTNTAETNGTVLLILSRPQWEIWTANIDNEQKPSNPYVAPKNQTYLMSEYRVPFCDRVTIRHSIVASRPERYYVGVLNVHQNQMSLEGSMEFVNPFGQHLPYQMVHMPDMLFCMTVFFSILLAIMALILFTVWVRGATLLHSLLLVCLVLKVTNLALHWRYYEIMSRFGESAPWRYEVWQLCKRLYDISEVFLLLLTALGWKLLRARLSTTELKFMVLAFCSSILLAMLQAWSRLRLKGGSYVDEPGMSFELIFYIIRVVCYLVIIFAMNLNLQLIEMHLRESPFTRTSAILYHKKQTYISFRRLFIVLVFRPSVEMLLQLLVVPRNWACEGLGEVCMLFVYAILFFIVRPIFANGSGLHYEQHRFMMLLHEPPQAGDSASETSLDVEDAQVPLERAGVDRETGAPLTARRDGSDAQGGATDGTARRRVASSSPGAGSSSRGLGSMDGAREGLRPRPLTSGWSMPHPVDEADIDVNYIPLPGN